MNLNSSLILRQLFYVLFDVFTLLHEQFAKKPRTLLVRKRKNFTIRKMRMLQKFITQMHKLKEILTFRIDGSFFWNYVGEQ